MDSLRGNWLPKSLLSPLVNHHHGGGGGDEQDEDVEKTGEHHLLGLDMEKQKDWKE